MGTIITGVALLDLTETSQATADGIKSISGVAELLYSAEAASVVAKLRISGVAEMMLVPKGYVHMTGDLDVEAGSLASLRSPIFFYVAGNLLLRPDVLAGMLEDKIDGLLVKGRVYCPEDLKGVVLQKLRGPRGQAVPYMKEVTSIVRGDLAIDNQYLASLEPGSRIVVLGKTLLLDEVEGNLLREKIERLDCLGKAVVLQACSELFLSRLHDRSRARIDLVPDGHRYIDETMVVDSASFALFNEASIYLTGSLVFDGEISADQLRRGIRRIVGTGTLTCERDLSPSMAQVCAGRSIKITTFIGKLLRNESEYLLTQDELERSTKGLTILNRGQLIVDPDVTVGSIDDRIASIDNYGDVSCDPHQVGAIQAKLKVNKGAVTVRRADEERRDDDDRKRADADRAEGDNVIQGLAYLKLA